MHYLLQEFNNFYQGKLDEVDQLKENEKLSKEKILEIKVEILRGFVADLGEQNLNLVETAKELQEAAEDRVLLLEKLLQKTTVGAKEYVKKLIVYQNEMQKINQEKKKLNCVIKHLQTKQETHEEEKKNLLAENSSLVNNLTALVQFINNIRSIGLLDHLSIELEPSMQTINTLLESIENFLYFRSNSLDETGSTNKDNSVFYDEAYNLSIHSHSVGSPSASFSCMSQDNCSNYGSHLTEKDVTIKRLQIDLDCMIKSRNDMHFKMLEKHRTIASLQSQITELQHALSLKEAECNSLGYALQTQQDQNRLTNVERCYFEELVRQLRSQLGENYAVNDTSKVNDTGVGNDTDNVLSCTQRDHGDFISMKVNCSTQTDLTQSKLRLWQKELNTLQSTVIGLKVSLIRSCHQHDCHDKTDELKKLHDSKHHLLTEENVKHKMLEKELDLMENHMGLEQRWIDHICRDKLESVKCHHDDCIIPLLVDNSKVATNSLKAKEMETTLSIPRHILYDNSSISNDQSPSNTDAKFLQEIRELKEKCLQLETQRTKLEEERDIFKSETDKLKEDLRQLEVASQETRVILTREIAERFDTIKVLRQEMAEQAELHKESVQQLVLKAEVIKGLRKELKQLHSKIEENETTIEKLTKEKLESEEKIQQYITEIENQKITMCNLQEALVQTKRSPDIVIGGNTVIANGSSVHTMKSRSPSSRDIFDI